MALSLIVDVEEAQKEDVREGEWDEEPDFVVECVTLGDKLVEIEGVTETVPLEEPDKQCVVLSLNVGVEEAHNVAVKEEVSEGLPELVVECVTLSDGLVEIEVVREDVSLGDKLVEIEAVTQTVLLDVPDKQ